MFMLTIPELFIERVTQDPESISAWAQTPSRDDQFFLDDDRPVHTGPEGWSPATYRETHRQVAGLAKRLASLGVIRGTPVAIWADTSERWGLVDLAIQCLGGITVGIYPTLLDEQVLYQLAHSETMVLLVDTESKAVRALSLHDELEQLAHVFSLHSGNVVPQLTPARPDLDWLQAQAKTVSAEHTSTYIYTSGTTGTPKAVVLTHHNFTAIIEATRSRLPLHEGERSVIFLPLAHVLQRFTQYRGLKDRAEGWFAPSIEALPATLPIARPHVLATVPRMLEKIRATIEARAEEKSAQARSILDWAISVGRTVNDMQWRQHPVGLRLKVQHKLAERLVFSKIRAGLGGSLRMLISGGAALDPELATWFEATGIAVREGWGLSETTAPAALNGEHDFRFGTVGKALDGTDVCLAEDGEILVQGPGVFQGYLKDDAATAAAFNAEGYFKTGDIGVIDEGFIRIVGRKKEIIVTAGGKNIAPVPIEQALEGGLIGQAIVIGDDRPFLIALLAVEPDRLSQRAQASGWPGGPEEWVDQPELMAEITDQVERAMDGFARFETIKKWCLVPYALTEDNGMLTPTLKLRRPTIHAHFEAAINTLYGS